MPLGSIPRPIVYSLSIVIVLLGFSVSYQVFIGTSFTYEGRLGSIQLGQGEDATTLAEFVDQSQQALAAAKSAIANLEAENDNLRTEIAAYRQSMQEIERTAGVESDSALKAVISDNLSNLATSNDVAARQAESTKWQRKLLDQQLTNTTRVQKLIDSEVKAPK